MNDDEVEVTTYDDAARGVRRFLNVRTNEEREEPVNGPPSDDGLND